ncbi:hypothetical protein D3C77_719670 [compost metagenome]
MRSIRDSANGGNIWKATSKPSSIGSTTRSLTITSTSMSGYSTVNSASRLPKWPMAKPGSICTRNLPVGLARRSRMCSVRLLKLATMSAHSL